MTIKYSTIIVLRVSPFAREKNVLRVKTTARGKDKNRLDLSTNLQPEFRIPIENVSTLERF